MAALLQQPVHTCRRANAQAGVPMLRIVESFHINLVCLLTNPRTKTATSRVQNKQGES